MTPDIPDLERRVFGALRTQDWLTVEDVATRAKVSIGNAKLLCELLFSEGHVVRRDVNPNCRYPNYRYRANSACMQTPHREHFAALMAATEPVEQER